MINSAMIKDTKRNSEDPRYKKWLGRKRKKKNKYRNHIVTVNDIKFDSKKEADRYLYLLDQFGKGIIKNLQLQPQFKFPMGFAYFADFKYTRDDKVIVEDVKGPYRNDVYKLKKKCFLHFFPKLTLCEV